MSDSYIQVALDSNGKKLQTFLNEIDGQDVHAEAVTIVRPDGDPALFVGGAMGVALHDSSGIGLVATPAGFLQVKVTNQVVVAIQDGSDVTQGVTTGTAVVTDADGTLQQYLRGLVKLASDAPSSFKNLGANATLNVKASAGKVLSLSCYNVNAAARFLQLHNTATTPAGSAVPIFSFLVPPLGQIVIGTDFFSNAGCSFSTGIAFGFSTARDIYTAGSAGDQSTWIQYK